MLKTETYDNDEHSKDERSNEDTHGWKTASGLKLASGSQTGEVSSRCSHSFASTLHLL